MKVEHLSINGVKKTAYVNRHNTNGLRKLENRLLKVVLLILVLKRDINPLIKKKVIVEDLYNIYNPIRKQNEYLNIIIKSINSLVLSFDQ